MSGYDIYPKFTFLGHIPPGSTSEHLCIVLGKKDGYVICCYCTSREPDIVFRYNDGDCYCIAEHHIRSYFPKKKNRRTYVYITEEHIFELPCFTVERNIKDGTYTKKDMLADEVYQGIMETINSSLNISEAIRQKIFSYL